MNKEEFLKIKEAYKSARTEEKKRIKVEYNKVKYNNDKSVCKIMYTLFTIQTYIFFVKLL